MRLIQSPMSYLALSAGILVSAVQLNFGAVIETDSFQQAGSGVASFTPTYAAPANDVLLGLAPTTIAPSETAFDTEASGGTPVLTDGVFGPILAPAGPAHPSFAAGGGAAGTSLTYTLATPVILDSVVTLGGWNDGGRDTQAYTVSYGIGGVFTPLATVNYDPTGPAPTNVQTASQVVLNGFSIPGVDSLRFDFATAENGYQGYAELAATPEPASLSLLGLGALGLLARRRRLV